MGSLLLSALPGCGPLPRVQENVRGQEDGLDSPGPLNPVLKLLEAR